MLLCRSSSVFSENFCRMFLSCEFDHCCKGNMIELEQTKSSDRNTVGRVWLSEFDGYRFDSRNRQIFDIIENTKIYVSNEHSINLLSRSFIICLIIFVNNNLLFCQLYRFIHCQQCRLCCYR